VQRVAVFERIHGDGFRPEFDRGPETTNRDFSAIRDENFLEHASPHSSLGVEVDYALCCVVVFTLSGDARNLRAQRVRIGPHTTFREYVQANKKIANFSYKSAISQ
jgi:hypothetical protein